MELENIDKAYNRSKTALGKSGGLMTTVETLRKEVKTLRRNIEDIQIEIIRAGEDGDKAAEKAAQAKLKTAKAELQAKQKRLENSEKIVRQNQSTIDAKMDELSQDPALKAHLEEVIGKKFTRKLSKIEKDKADKVKQNETLTKIQEAAKKDFNVMYSLKEIEKYTKLILENQAIITDSSKAPVQKAKAQADLNTSQESLDKARSNLAKYFKGTVSREVIDNITSYEDLGKKIKSNSKYMKGLDKQTANYRTALENIGYELPSRDDSSYGMSYDSSSTTRTTDRGTLYSRTSSRRPFSTELPAEQPKWYQFIKRFKNWHSRRKMYREEEREETSTIPVSQEDKRKFKNSMKYDVIKDYEEKVATDLLKQAKAQNRYEREEQEEENQL